MPFAERKVMRFQIKDAKCLLSTQHNGWNWTTHTKVHYYKIQNPGTRGGILKTNGEKNKNQIPAKDQESEYQWIYQE